MALSSLEKKRVTAQSANSLRFNTYSTFEICTVLVQITPLESALTDSGPVNPLECALTKNRGRGWVNQ